MNKKKILVVDDEIKILNIIRSYLQRSGYDVICCQDGYVSLELTEQEQPDLIILDLMLPGLSGEEVCRKIRGFSRIPIIMLTAKSAEDSAVMGFALGADDYVVKPFSPRLLVARVDAILRRVSDAAAPLSAVLSYGDLSVDAVRHEVRKCGERIGLTPAEFNILYCMAKYPKKTFTREELIQSALGDDFDGYDRVIDAHIKNLRQKIEANPKEPEYIRTVHGVGYAFGDGE